MSGDDINFAYLRHEHGEMGEIGLEQLSILGKREVRHWGRERAT